MYVFGEIWGGMLRNVTHLCDSQKKDFSEVKVIKKGNKYFANFLHQKTLLSFCVGI